MTILLIAFVVAYTREPSLFATSSFFGPIAASLLEPLTSSLLSILSYPLFYLPYSLPIKHPVLPITDYPGLCPNQSQTGPSSRPPI